MASSRFSRDFITDARIAFAAKLADQIAAEDLSLSAFDCAERAVRKVFGRWLLDFRATVPAPLIPLYYRLIGDVEQRIGLHRRSPGQDSPSQPAVAKAATTDVAQTRVVALRAG